MEGKLCGLFFWILWTVVVLEAHPGQAKVVGYRDAGALALVVRGIWTSGLQNMHGG